MRDIAIMIYVVGGALWALKHPWIGVLMWTNVSLMSPHVEWGYATAGWPVALIVALTTLLGALMTKEKQNPFTMGSPVLALLAFTIWICITLPFSFYFDESLPLFQRSIKIFLMVFVTLMLLDERYKLDAFIWVMVGSLAFYGVKGGAFTLATAGNYRVWGPGGFIGGNNELALALVTTIPLLRYLQLQLKKRWQRLGMGAAMGLTAITVLGTYSRGALLALAAMAALFWLKGRNKFLWGVLLAVTGVAILSFMPEQWWDRMNTIKTYDADDSALGRINAWWMAWNLAQDKVFGGGFMIYFYDVFARYSPEPNRVHAAHSIYFQVMGEHGFIGFFLFMLTGVLTWVTSNRLIRAAREDERFRWAAELGAMVQVSMIGFAAGGAFLSLAYFDLPYNLMIIVVVALHLVRRQQRAPKPVPLAAAQATAAPAAPAAPPHPSSPSRYA